MNPFKHGLAVSARPSRLGVMDHRNAVLAATCHCGAIRIYVRQISRTLTSCNCPICRRYGALWAYYTASSVTIKAPKGGLSKYSWNRKIRAYYRCKKCGCVTHYAYRKKRRNTTVAVNAVNSSLLLLSECGSDISTVRHRGSSLIECLSRFSVNCASIRSIRSR